MTEADVRKTNGFSLLELMIALGVMTLIATISVPKVQVWNARNRGLQTAMELISDFSKARSVAGYTVATNDSSGVINIYKQIPDDEETDDSDDGDNKMPVYMGVRRQTAMVFRKSEYAIYQKQSADTSSWDATALLLKRNSLLNTVSLESVNGGEPSDEVTDFDTVLNFTSTGMLKDSIGQFYSDKGNQSSGRCGSDVTARYLPNIIFSATIRSKVSMSGNDSIWYRVDIDQRGEYAICTLFKSAASVSDNDFSNNGVMLDM